MARFALILLCILSFRSLWGEDVVAKALIRDIATVEGIRDNPILGYGIVAGLNGTGDRQQTLFTIQSLANALQRMGLKIPVANAQVRNVAAVFVTATLPPFARPGTAVDVTVSSIGDAKSLEGGLLLLTSLYGADGTVYAAAQGPITLGGYTAGGAGNAKQVNHPTVGRIPGGASVERDASLNLQHLETLSLLLSEPDFSTAEEVAAVINHDFQREIASAADSRRIDVRMNPGVAPNASAMLARIENLAVTVRRRARVVVNERTGTVVMGRSVRLGAVSILHGNISIEIATQFNVSQPAPWSRGETTVTPQAEVRTNEAPARRVELSEGASVEQLVNGLQTIGASARDVIAILQAIKAAGALEAELEVI